MLGYLVHRILIMIPTLIANAFYLPRHLMPKEQTDAKEAKEAVAGAQPAPAAE